jgi:tetratricopeptide (TPR) repeat protein
MSLILRHPALRLGLAFLLIILLAPQPNWLPLLADIHLASQSPNLTTESVAALTDAYQRQPWNPDLAHTAGLASLAIGDFDSAIAALNVTVARTGWTPDLHIALGDAYAGKNDLDQALTHWEAALPDRLNDAGLLNKLARTYEAQGRYPEASAVLRSLVALEPQNAVARYRFGLVLSVIDPASAPQHLALAAGMDPSVAPFAASLNNAVEAGLKAGDQAYTYGIIGYTLIAVREYALAKAALLRAIEERSDFADAYAYLGLAEDELGNDGTYAFDRAFAIKPDLPLAHYLVGLHYRRTGEVDKAIQSLQKAFELDPSNAAAAAELGSIYSDAADVPNAENWYRQAVRVAPEDGTFWLLLAQFYAGHELRLDNDALLSARKAVELDPASVQAYDTLGYVYYLNEQFAEAETNLLKARELDPTQPSVYFHLGLVYLDSNRLTESKENLEKAVDLGAGGPIAEQAFKALARLGITTAATPAPDPTATP